MALTKTKLKNFKKLFLNKKNELVKIHMQKLNEAFDIEIEGDEIDVVQSTIIKSMTDKLSGRDLDNLNKINAALQRIEEGSFGTCRDCDENIPEKRLEALPHCETCVECAEEEEKYNKQYRQW